ncbi:hypothetical protein O3P69_009996 [Scylla paramamosain]|uniref:RNase H type-1 domain-containing protein n=1 Tax=Scylla paramamosain TaxID=85552 RepID=A0AAW0SPQ9_SCYPA
MVRQKAPNTSRRCTETESPVPRTVRCIGLDRVKRRYTEDSDEETTAPPCKSKPQANTQMPFHDASSQGTCTSNTKASLHDDDRHWTTFGKKPKKKTALDSLATDHNLQPTPTDTVKEDKSAQETQDTPFGGLPRAVRRRTLHAVAYAAANTQRISASGNTRRRKKQAPDARIAKDPIKPGTRDVQKTANEYSKQYKDTKHLSRHYFHSLSRKVSLLIYADDITLLVVERRHQASAKTAYTTYTSHSLQSAATHHRISRQDVKIVKRPPPSWIREDWLKTPKVLHIPTELKAITLRHLTPLVHKHELTIYRDGSVDPDTGAAGAAFVSQNMTQRCRVSDGASSIQTELIAIKGVLEYIETVIPCSALIATDSKAALQTLKKNKVEHNVHLVTLIHKTGEALQEAGTQICLIWIPSHIGIHGNDKADTAAKEAATKENIDITATAPYPHQKQHQETHLNKHETRTCRRGNKRIRMGYPSPGKIITNEIIPPCNHCNKDTDIPLLHYILECPAKSSLLQNTGGTPGAGSAAAREAAAKIIFETSTADLLKVVVETPPPK